MANDPIKLVDVGALDRFKTDIENEIPESIQYSTMPTASADLVGSIVQFIGTTTSSYQNGYFYRCQTGFTAGTYEWKEVSQAPIWKGTRAEHTAAEQAGTLPDNALIGITDESGNPIIFNIPSQNGTLTYDGTEKTPSWNDYNPDQLRITGTTSATNAGTYTVTFTPRLGYMWDDETTSGKKATWSIRGMPISVVPSQSGVLSYTGNAVSPAWSNYSTSELDISGDTEGINVGTYTATFTPKANYEWYDGSKTGKNSDWIISSATIATIPSQSGTITYDGTEKTASWSNYDSSQLTVTGNTATNAGTYTASFVPTANYKWSDGTTAAKTASWEIDKANGSVTLSTNSVTLDDSHLTAIVTTTNATGTISVSSNDQTIAAAVYDNNSITITATQKAGSTSITVSVGSSNNYNSTTATINVSADFLVPKDWKDGVNQATDAEVRAMIAAADAGTLDLSLYWAIGDKRTVHLSAMTAGDALNTVQPEQDVVLVLVDTGVHSGYKDINNKLVNFVWGQENCLVSCGRMNAVNQNNSTWSNCDMRTDLNNKYYNALPIEFKSCLKQFNVVTAQTYDANITETTHDYISLFAEKEIHNVASYGNSVEANSLVQFSYYETSINRRKYVQSSLEYYWERSPREGQSFCLTAPNGNPSYSSSGDGYARMETGVAPFGCI